MKQLEKTYPGRHFSIEKLGPCGAVDLNVAADAELSVYIVDASNRERFEGDVKFAHHGPGGVTDFRGRLLLPGVGPWWLIVENRSRQESRLTMCWSLLP